MDLISIFASFDDVDNYNAVDSQLFSELIIFIDENQTKCH